MDELFTTNLAWWFENTEELRRAVKDFICSEYEKQHPQYEAARKAIVGKFDR